MRLPLLSLPVVVLLGVCINILSACDSFVSDVDPPIDRVPDEALNDPEQLPFLTTGVRESFNSSQAFAVVMSGGMSDELFYGGPQAFLVAYSWVDEGYPRLDNVTLFFVFGATSELRFLADDLLRRIEKDMSFEGVTSAETERYAEYRRAAEFAGYFYGGVARARLAHYFGLTEREGGATIDNSPLIPADDLYAQALDRLERALDFAEDDYMTRVVHSVMARIHLYRGDLGAARASAQQGLVEGDLPFQTNHAETSPNWVWGRAGFNSVQYAVADHFVAYDDPRVPVEEYAPGFYRQALYPDVTSPVTFMSWQETNLILAEVALLQDGDAEAARTLVNANRAAVSLPPLESFDLDALILERAKELFCEGARMIDQRRFDRWHLADDTWRYFPIPQAERDSNPNL